MGRAFFLTVTCGMNWITIAPCAEVMVEICYTCALYVLRLFIGYDKSHIEGDKLGQPARLKHFQYRK